MTAAVKAGVSYFALVYMAGFMLGTLRVLFVVPWIGETAAVSLETPILLAASWMASRWCAATFQVAPNAKSGLLMGAVAFALLVVGELGVSVFAFGRSLESALAAFGSTPGMIGLSAQVAFGLLPLVQATLCRDHAFVAGDRF